METPAYAIDLEAELMRRLARPPKVPKPKLESRSQQIHAKLLRQVEATRARVARSDISLTELLDGRSDRFPSSPRCIWHGSGAAAVTGVAPLYYEGPDCEYTSANHQIEKSNETILKLNAQLKDMMETEEPDLEQERQNILAVLQERRLQAEDLQKRLNIDPTQETFYPVHLAALLGDATLMRLLLQHGANVQQRSSLGRSAWEMAVQKNVHGSHDEVLLLLAEPVTFCNLRAAMQLMQEAPISARKPRSEIYSKQKARSDRLLPDPRLGTKSQTFDARLPPEEDSDEDAEVLQRLAQMVKMDADLDPAEHGAHSAGISLGAPEPPRRMAELRAAAERRLRQSSREPLKDGCD
eukprot:g1636.t1